MKPKPQYSIGIRKKFTGRFGWMLVPMCRVNIDLDSVMSINDYETEKEAKNAAEHFMKRNDMVKYVPTTKS